MPEEFGVIAMMHIFIILAQCFIVSGFSTSLIQKKDADRLDFSTILYCSLFLAVIIYSIIYITSPFVADFYREPILEQVMRVYGLTLFISAYNSVQRAWVARHMKFKLFFYSTLSGNVVSGIIGITMAYAGFGVWALVSQVLSSQIINTIVLAVIIPWHPEFVFSKYRAIPLIKYGWKILGSDLISTVYFQLRQLLIGKFYSASDLAFYNRGVHIPELVSSNIDKSLGEVLFPALSNQSDSTKKIKEMTRKTMRLTSYILFFVLTLLIILADPIVRIVYTEKWIQCVPYFQLMALAKMIQTVSHANIQSFKAVGRSDIVLKLEFIKKPIGFLLIFVSFPISVFAVALTVPIYGLYSAFVNASANKKVLRYTLGEQFSDLRPAILLSMVIYALSFVYMDLGISDVFTIIIGVSLSTLLYWGVSSYLKLEAYMYCKSKLYKIIKRIKWNLQ
jgi:O-antigen/teichoic acid export membrane protein